MRWQTKALVVSAGFLFLARSFPARSESQPPEPNLSFEIDVSPQDEKPDGWTIRCGHGATCETKRGSAAAGRWCVVLASTKPGQWARIGLPAASVLRPNSWYRISYWALARGDSLRFGWRLGSEDLTEVSDELDAMEDVLLPDGKWRLRQTPPFRVTAARLERFPLLVFCLDEPHVGSVELDDIRISPSAPD